ncbi:DUF7507 domain-containing protein [Luteimonas deserti]|uniref:DUF11 domain-containing protein n=1 Tax=Luteimonas deserti TaxID=2752306 RepID=A0A7Z0QPF9_9GAMM|nr:Ig-like domain-containing protein [Luteimonas deserti]NYZ62397.1 DUF11 domain-containing protein [Luteimonas deserti]
MSGLLVTLVSTLVVGASHLALAQSATVTNVATVAAPQGLNDIDPSSDTSSVTITLSAPDVDFCAAGDIYNIINGAGLYRYSTALGSDARVAALDVSLGTDLNALMIDPGVDRSRLLFHAAGTGIVWAYDPTHPVTPGWYQTGAVVNANLPRAGMTRDGVGYLVTAVSGPADAPVAQMYRLERNGAYGYSISGPMPLTYDVNPTDRGSGDIAFDAQGIGWLVAGADLYRVDVAAGTATRQQNFSGAPAGVNYAGAAFGADDRLYVVVNSSGAYYAMDLAAGTMTPAGSSSSGAGRDLASCGFPDIQPAQLQVEKTLASITRDGTIVAPGTIAAPGDLLTYAIEVRHVGGTQAATLFPGAVVETVPAFTSRPAAADDFTCTGTACTNTQLRNIAVGASTTFRFSVVVDPDLPATVTEIANAVTVTGIDCTAPGNDCSELTPVDSSPSLASSKTLTAVNGAPPAGPVEPGDVLTYTVVASNTGNVVLPTVVVEDSRITPATVTCAPLAPGSACSLVGLYTVTSADIAAGTIRNTAVVTTPDTPSVCPAGATDPVCRPVLEIPTVPATPALTIVKTAGAPSGDSAGSTIDYSFLVTNTGNVTLDAIAIDDDRLDAAAVCPVTTLAPGATTTCTGTHTITQAEVDAGEVLNTATATGTTPGGGTTTSPPDDADVPLSATPGLSIVKTAGVPGGNTAGSTIDYSFVVTNTGGVTLTGIAIDDDRLDAPAVCPVTTLAPGATTTCTGTHTITQAEVDAGEVLNTATATGTTPGGGTTTSPPDDENVVLERRPALTTEKALTSNADEDGTGTVTLGDTLTYTVSATNSGTVTLTDVVIQDSRITPASVTCAALAPGARCLLVGTYVVTRADVVAGQVLNIAAVTTGEPGICPAGDPSPVCNPSVAIEVVPYEIDAVDDSTTTGQNTPVRIPVLDNDTLNRNPVDPDAVTLDEVTPPTNGRITVNPDGTITYTPDPGFSGEDRFVYRICEIANPDNCDIATVTITIRPNVVEAIDDDAGTVEPGVPTPVVVVDNDRSTGAPLDPGSVTIVTPPGHGTVACTGGICTYTPRFGFTGQDSFVYRVCDTSFPVPVCDTATVTVRVEGQAPLRVSKSAAVREVKVGDLVRYTVTVENIGNVSVAGAHVLDTPAQGFSYVDGSIASSNGRALTVSGHNPIRIGSLDLAPGERIELTYLMRVGAGIRAGTHLNRALAQTGDGIALSNVATAQVQTAFDPLLDDSLVFGTVFDDRNGDGWQASAAMRGVHVQGGFAPGAYIAGSTTVDRGAGPQPVADASAPLLRGLALGEVAGRQSAADPAEARQVTIRQRLRAADFTGDFVLTSREGVTLRMAADGSTRLERSGEAAAGRSAAEPTVTRRVLRDADGVAVEYVVANAGIDERGIPGVRIAAVEGLLIETDQYGRYHLVDVPGGNARRGRNFILKVDPATLPAGSAFTTANPLLRRVTPGLPVRFDFGVRLPVVELQGGRETVELELGEVLFEPDSSVLREAHLSAIDAMAVQVDRHGGGSVIITGEGEHQALAFARAASVRDALQARIDPAAAAALQVELRTRVDDPHALVAGVDASGVLLAKVLFDTDRAEIRPEFEALLDAVARRLDALGGGQVGIVGHTDVRGSHAYNVDLGLRRAQAVFDALSTRLSPEVRARVRVDASRDPSAPVGEARK